MKASFFHVPSCPGYGQVQAVNTCPDAGSLHLLLSRAYEHEHQSTVKTYGTLEEEGIHLILKT